MKPTRPRLSVILITLDEERLLGSVLESVRWADEIVIVDSGSTDRTEEIARRHTDRFYVREYVGEGHQRQHSLELATGDWVLQVDGDEVVTPELRASIERALADPGDAVAFRVRLHTLFLGQRFGSRGWRREWKLRLFRRDRGRFSPVRIHSRPVVDGPVGRLEGVLLHHPYRDLAHFVEKMNRYSSRSAEDIARRRRGSALWAFLRGAGVFLKEYVFGGGFLYGQAGLVRSSVMAQYAFLKYAKVWEKGLGAGPAVVRGAGRDRGDGEGRPFGSARGAPEAASGRGELSSTMGRGIRRV